MNKQFFFNFIDKACNYLPTRKIPRLTRKYAARILRVKDYTLNSGERQTSESLDGIRVDHTARYQVAIDFLQKHYGDNPMRGYDVFCGVGYGAFMLSNAMQNVELNAIDGSNEAIKLAQKHYQTGRINFEQKLFPFDLPVASADFFISLESIEHVKNDTDFLKLIDQTLKSDGILIISMPNVEKWQLENHLTHFHFRHYSPSEFIEMLTQLGFHFICLFGQDTYKMNERSKIQDILDDKDMGVKADYEGQNCIYIFQKNK